MVSFSQIKQQQLWLDVGYEVAEGRLEGGHSVTLQRTPSSSPEFLENHSPVDDLIQFMSFNSTEEQSQWIADRNHEEPEGGGTGLMTSW